MSFTTEPKQEIHVIGISCRTSNAPNRASTDIPKLWMKFYSENISALIPNKASDQGIAVYCDYESDFTGEYTLVLGCPVTSLDNVPDGLVAKTIPSGTYAKFVCAGKPPESVFTTWQTIWQEKNLNRSYIADYELYTSPEDISVFVGI